MPDFWSTNPKLIFGGGGGVVNYNPQSKTGQLDFRSGIGNTTFDKCLVVLTDHYPFWKLPRAKPHKYTFTQVIGCINIVLEEGTTNT